MNILISTDQIYLHGGIEKVMATKVNYWCTLPNVKVYIVTTEQRGKDSCYALDKRVELIDLGINYNRSKSYFSKENLGKSKMHFLKQRNLFRKLQPDVIISPNYNFDHYWLPFIKGKAKLIKERHGSRYLEEEARLTKSFFTKLKLRFHDWIDSLYSTIVVLNESEKHFVKSGNAIVIPNPVEEKELKAPLVNKQVIAAGRISPVKGFDELIYIWEVVSKKFPDWQLHIYGDDYLNTKTELSKKIEQLGLQGKIVFKASVSDIPTKMTAYSIYVMTSVTECFPMVLLEALSVGVPIVSYDCPTGPRHILTNLEDGFLVKNKSREEFALRLMHLMENEDERIKMGTFAKKNYLRFSTQLVMSQWMTLLRK